MYEITRVKKQSLYHVISHVKRYTMFFSLHKTLCMNVSHKKQYCVNTAFSRMLFLCETTDETRFVILYNILSL